MCATIGRFSLVSCLGEYNKGKNIYHYFMLTDSDLTQNLLLKKNTFFLLSRPCLTVNSTGKFSPQRNFFEGIRNVKACWDSIMNKSFFLSD